MCQIERLCVIVVLFCIQLFRQAKSFFDNPSIELVGGVSLIKSNEGRQGKSLSDNSLAIEVAPTVEARNSEMGTYLMESAKNFFAERSLNLNFANTARSIARAIPDDIKSDIKEFVGEGRTKKKKIVKKLLPFILAIGGKLAFLAVGSLFGLLVLAKKALIISVLAFGLALVSGIAGIASKAGGSGSSGGGLLGGLGGLFGGKQSGGSGNAGWSSGGSGGSNGWSSSSGSGWDSHGAYSSPVAQSIAYSGYKQS